MVHTNALLTPRTRERLARLVVEDGWTYSAAAKMFMVSPVTARKWAERWRGEGRAGMEDRSSRPRRCPTRTTGSTARKITKLRWRHRLGPVQIGGRLGLPASTVHAVLVRNRLNRLSHLDRVSGEPLRRYEHDHPGSMIHIDVTKFANIPDGGGHRYVGRQQGGRNQRATPRLARGADNKPGTGIAFLHTVIDDHSRLANVEICTDEKASTAVAVLRRAAAWYAERGVQIERVLSDNGSCYRSHACATPAPSSRSPTHRPGPTADQRHDRTVPPHPRRRLGRHQPLHLRRRTPSSPTGWLHFYNHHRIHSAIGGTPTSRLNNLPGHHS